jgi:hypothetical protein
MYVVVQHRFKDPQTAFARGERLIKNEGAPTGVRGLQFYPASDGSGATCLWEAESVDWGAFTGALHHHRLEQLVSSIPGKEAAHGLTGSEDVRLARRLRRSTRREHRLGRCGTLR